MTKKLFFLLILLLISATYLFSMSIALGAEALYSPSLLTVGDSSSFLSEGNVSLFTTIQAKSLRYSMSLGIGKSIEHHSFHRFSKLVETTSLFFSSSVGYLFGNSNSINLGVGIKLTSIGSPPYNTRVLSPTMRLTYRKEYKGKANTPDFFLLIPLAIMYGKTAKGISLGIGLGYSFSHGKEDKI